MENEKSKILAPNNNYVVEKCANCKKDFLKRIAGNGRISGLAKGAKGKRARNCSTICSRKWRDYIHKEKSKSNKARKNKDGFYKCEYCNDKASPDDRSNCITCGRYRNG